MFSSGFKVAFQMLPRILLFRPEHQSGAIVFTQIKNVLTNARRNSLFILQPDQLAATDARLRVFAKKYKQLTALANLIPAMPYIQPNSLCEKQEKLHIPFNLYGIYNGSIAELFGLEYIPTYEYKGVTYPKPFAMLLDPQANVLAKMELTNEDIDGDVVKLLAMASSFDGSSESVCSAG